MADTPLASIEVRWFFEGPARRNFELKHWFENTGFPGGKGGTPEWLGRLDDQPDRYLVLPRAVDLGLKWREGQFQVKGRTADLGLQHFSQGHVGRVERWMKWSYSKVPDAYRDLFTGELPGLRSAAVGKTRATFKYRLDTFSGVVAPVALDEAVDRGLAVELAEIEVGDSAWTSLGFEAFPDDAAISAHFLAAVDAILATLEGIQLDAGRSLSYPRWLQQISGAGAG